MAYIRDICFDFISLLSSKKVDWYVVFKYVRFIACLLYCADCCICSSFIFCIKICGSCFYESFDRIKKDNLFIWSNTIINSADDEISAQKVRVYCQNVTLNLLLSYFAEQAEHEEISMTVRVDSPAILNISANDL